jgi:hypothetical protein
VWDYTKGAECHQVCLTYVCVNKTIDLWEMATLKESKSHETQLTHLVYAGAQVLLAFTEGEIQRMKTGLNFKLKA